MVSPKNVANWALSSPRGNESQSRHSFDSWQQALGIGRRSDSTPPTVAVGLSPTGSSTGSRSNSASPANSRGSRTPRSISWSARDHVGDTMDPRSPNSGTPHSLATEDEEQDNLDPVLQGDFNSMLQVSFVEIFDV